MRTISSLIWDVWNRGGPFVGDVAPNAAVVADGEWLLRGMGVVPGPDNGTSWVAGTYINADLGTPNARHDVPHVRSIDIDRSLDQDAATCRITLVNWDIAQIPGRTDALGTRGAVSWFPGASSVQPPEQQARWYPEGSPSGGLHGVLHPNTLIRTYQGYGGRSLPWQDAVDAGNLAQTGTWLIDDVEFSHDGSVELRCRDMAKLLIEQSIIPTSTPAWDDGFGGIFSGIYPVQFTYGVNYSDYVDIITTLCKWAGWNTPDDTGVFGNFESTGAFFPDGPVTKDVFDKRPFIDAIHAIKEIVGYVFMVDEDGMPRFESPNFWFPGNWDESRNRVAVPEIDERLQLLEHHVVLSDRSQRFQLYVSPGDPWTPGVATVDDFNSLYRRTAGFTWAEMGRFNAFLRRVGVWSNGAFTDSNERANLVRLLMMFMFFDIRRGGPITCPGNPALQLNDQVRVWEETTAESYIHYIRGISSHQDLESGEYTMALTTNWLGDYPDHWAANLGTTGGSDQIIMVDEGGGADLEFIFLPRY